MIRQKLWNELFSNENKFSFHVIATVREKWSKIFFLFTTFFRKKLFCFFLHVYDVIYTKGKKAARKKGKISTFYDNNSCLLFNIFFLYQARRSGVSYVKNRMIDVPTMISRDCCLFIPLQRVSFNLIVLCGL